MDAGPVRDERARAINDDLGSHNNTSAQDELARQQVNRTFRSITKGPVKKLPALLLLVTLKLSSDGTRGGGG